MNHGIYWLASYPKSGNTWLRAVISNYLQNSDTPVDINDLKTDSIASSRKHFDDHTCLDSSDMCEEQIRLYQPLVFEGLAKEAKHDLYVKVHDAYTYNQEGKPLFPSNATKGVLYLVRNPLDVAVSYSHHNTADITQTIKNLNDPNLTIAKSKKRLDAQLPQRMLSWSMHVESWSRSGLPLLIVRYEDMREKPYETFYDIMTFLGFEVEEDQLKKALYFSSFEELQKQESANGFKEKPLKSNKFFRKGEVGGYTDELGAEMIEDVTKHHIEWMKNLGYCL